MVQAGRQKEMENIHRHNLQVLTPTAEARHGKHVRARFVDTWKGEEVRSRLVAQEFAHGYRSDVSQCTPGLKAFRLVVAFAATRFPEDKGVKHLWVWDISVAFMHATLPESEVIFVWPPRGYTKKGYCWRLRGAMNGTRVASQAWGTHVTKEMKAMGGMEIAVTPMTFWFPGRRILLAVHGDDFLGAGNTEALSWLGGQIAARFDSKCVSRIGPDGEKQGKILKRTITWSTEGFTWEADPTHALAAAEKM
eukprot:3705262-Amphidinium_carterae.1